MKPASRLILIALACAFALTASPAVAKPPAIKVTYHARRIDVPPSKIITAIALNDQGQALLRTAKCPDCARDYFLWSAGTAIRISIPSGASTFDPVGLGPNETFAGVSQYGSGPQPTIRSFVGHVAGDTVTFSALLDPADNADSVEAVAMDSAGDILGQTTGTPVQFLVWTPGASTAQPLNLAPPAGTTTTVTALDAAGDYAGIAQGPGGSEAVVWPRGGAPIVLPHSLDPNSTTAGSPAIGGITPAPAGRIYVTEYQSPVGYVRTKCGVWTLQVTAGKRATVGPPAWIKTIGGSAPGVISSGVNPNGAIVGASWSPDQAKALIYHNGAEKALRALITGPRPPASAFDAIPAGINATGQILLGDWLLTPA